MQRLIPCDIERHGEADGHLGGELDLGEGALLANARDALSDGLFVPIEGRQGELGNAGHDNGSVKRQSGLSYILRYHPLWEVAPSRGADGGAGGDFQERLFGWAVVDRINIAVFLSPPLQPL
jgi:hypothetical protein